MSKVTKAVSEVLVNQYAQPSSALEVARTNAVEGIMGGYGATRDYAIMLNEYYAPDSTRPIAHWFDVEHTFKDDFSLAVNAEKKMFYNALNEKAKAKGAVTNPSTYWARIRKAGKEERLGTMSDEIAGEGSEGGDLINEGASGESNERSPQLRYVDELTRLYKFGERKGAELPANLLDVHKLVGQALEKCGVKLNMISA
jgi:hypothetical protein